MQQSPSTVDRENGQGEESPERGETEQSKRQKMKALRKFLKQADKTHDTIAESEPIQSETTEQLMKLETSICHVCQRQLNENQKLWYHFISCSMFCKEQVCLEHFRKKRKIKGKDGGKFGRICDSCEDKHLFQVYTKQEVKAEESLCTQQLIIKTKYEEINDLRSGKQTKVQLLKAKRKQIEQQMKEEEERYGGLESQLGAKCRKVEHKTKEVQKLEATVAELERTVPPALEPDYQALVEQNNKIKKDLVKHEKMCNEALKAKSVLEKQMYDEYYEWEKRQAAKVQKKKDECTIY